jgi:hypothetical protein
VKEGPINADSNQKGRRANSAPPSPDVSDANSKSHYSFHSKRNRGRTETVTKNDYYEKKEEKKGGKRKNSEDFVVKDIQGPHTSCLKGEKTKPFFSFKAQRERSQPSMVYKPKKDGKSAGGSRGKKDKSPRGKLSTYPLVTLSDPNNSLVLEGNGSGEDPKSF